MIRIERIRDGKNITRTMNHMTRFSPTRMVTLSDDKKSAHVVVLDSNRRPTQHQRQYRIERYHSGSSWLNSHTGWTVNLLDDVRVHSTHPAHKNGIHSSEFYGYISDEFEESHKDLASEIEKLDQVLFG